MKKAISIRIETEILEYFRDSFPQGYQSAIHRVLKQYVTKQKRQTSYQAGRAQELFRRFYTRCFWHLDRDLVITPDLVPLIIAGLRKDGGHEGFFAAHDLEMENPLEDNV